MYMQTYTFSFIEGSFNMFNINELNECLNFCNKNNQRTCLIYVL